MFSNTHWTTWAIFGMLIFIIVWSVFAKRSTEEKITLGMPTIGFGNSEENVSNTK